jgi:2-oxoglutarate dehydrogenase E2 component (dihydrolipoamide succinyltransferase)
MSAVPVRVPQFGAEGDEIRLTCWFVEVGEEVRSGERIAEVRIPGVTYDVTAPAGGVLSRIEVWNDALVVETMVLGWIEADATESEETA